MGDTHQTMIILGVGKVLQSRGNKESNNNMWYLSFAENPPPPVAGVYGALGAAPAPSEHSQSVERSRASTGHGASSSGGSDPNEMSRSGTDLPHHISGRESEGTAI